MIKAVRKNRFLGTESEVENVVSSYLSSLFRGLGRFLLRSLQGVAFTVLATFGAWPGAAYLVYMAMES